MLEQTGLAQPRPDETLDRFARLAATLLGVPVSYVSIVAEDRQVLPGMSDSCAAEDEPRSQPLPRSICKFSVATGEELVIEDISVDPLVRTNAELRAQGLRSYAGWPLITAEGHVLGNLCVLDRQPRQWSDEDLDALRDLGALVLQELERRITAANLQRLRTGVEQLLERLDTTGPLVRSLTQLADETGDPRAQRGSSVLKSHLNEVLRATAAVREQLTFSPSPSSRRSVDIGDVVVRVVEGAKAVTDAFLTLHRDPGPMLLDCDPASLEQAISHLVVTLVHHSRGKAAVNVRLRVVDDAPPLAVLEVNAPSARVPGDELGRLAERLDATDKADAAEEEHPAVSITTTPRSSRASSGSVRASSSAATGVRLTAWWTLTGR
ncbi:GAF domain-containing protein [Kineococcus indalonis]|uniref:GAF domain-containing protein n=1 Tax=Kineococcus indalonis TaxID=2696566 RepID=UPI00141353A5|nr:GAF domain-containing protein [Kineococcus indalonis]NAZ86276.1 GAF domain-containing protein [Kineococcus indalonis]